MLWWWFGLWPLGLFFLWLHKTAKKPVPASARNVGVDSIAPVHAATSNDDDDAMLPTTSAPGQPNGKSLHRYGRDSQTWWHVLSEACERLDENKSVVGKLVNRMYRRIFSEHARARAPLEEGNQSLLNWIVALRFWTFYAFRFATLACFMAPVLVVLLFYPHVWLPWLARANVTHPYDDATSVHSGNGVRYEWHQLGDTRRVVPVCIHADSAEVLYDSEMAYLDAHDMLHGQKPHARCVARLGDATQHAQQFGLPFSSLHAALVDAPSVAQVLKQQYGSYKAADAALNMSGAQVRPTIFVLRDGERYVKLAVRVQSEEGTAEYRIERRLVSITAVLHFLQAWQKDIAQHVPGTPMHYCMCPAFLGILDPIYFYYDASTAAWQLWFAAEVPEANTLTKYYGTRQAWSEKIAPLPYAQNQRFLDLFQDENQHVVAHYDAISVRLIDVAGYVPTATELDERERFWFGPNAMRRRTYDAAVPFALTVPIPDSYRVQRKLTGSQDTGCFYHCRHLIELLMRDDIDTA